MRILHTSDWHLGQHFMGKTREAEHSAWCAWLVQTVVEQQADALIVAGDIFDTGTPPSYARKQYNQFILQMKATGCQLILLAGNHDSVTMLNESKDLLAELNTQVIASVSNNLDDQLIPLKKRNGELGAVLCAVPFIRARDIHYSQAGQSAEEKQGSLQTAITEHYAQLFAKATAFCEEQNLQLPIIGTGHLTTVGASLTESVRNIYVGNLSAFPTNAFPAFDYLALGHIHRPQKVGGEEHLRYSGSPIALSFDEANRQKEILCVDFDATGLTAVTPIHIPSFQRLIALKGNLASLKEQLSQLAKELAPEPKAWLEVTVEEEDFYSDLSERVNQLCADLPVEVLRVRRQRKQLATSLSYETGEVLAELTPEDVFAKRLAQETLTDEQITTLKGLHAQVLEALQEAD